MVRFYTALTKEIDDPQAAAEEILEQLKPEETMLKNTIGIIYFYHEFAKMDIWQPFVSAMPFELAGCVSSYTGTNGQHGDAAVSVTMITSDDAWFVVRTIDGLEEKQRRQIYSEVNNLCDEMCTEEMPKLIMPFLSPLPHFSIDNLFHSIRMYNDSLLFFGMQTFNTSESENTNFVFGNGKMSVSKCVFVGFYGNIDPRFHIGSSIQSEKILGEEAVITESDGPLLKSVNGIPALNFFRKKGLLSSDNTGAGIMAISAHIIYSNGDKAGCAFLGIANNTEYVYAARSLEIGAKITFTYIEGDKILATTENVMREIKDMRRNDILIFTSVARALSLETNFFAELKKISSCAEVYEKETGTPLRYNAVYTGGEICPVFNDSGKYINMPHNYTFSVCSFN